MLFILALLAMKFPQKILLLVFLSLLFVLSFLALWRTPLYYLDINYNTEKIIVPQPAPSRQESGPDKVVVYKDTLLLDRLFPKSELTVTHSSISREIQPNERVKLRPTKASINLRKRLLNNSKSSKSFVDKPALGVNIRKVYSHDSEDKLNTDLLGQIFPRKSEIMKFKEKFVIKSDENSKATTENHEDLQTEDTTESRSTTNLHRQTKDRIVKGKEQNDSENSRRKTSGHEKNLIDSKLEFDGQFRKLEFIPKKDVHCINSLSNKIYGGLGVPIQIPDEQELENMSQNEVKCLYHRYVTTRQEKCTEIPQLGNSDLRDNGWHICMDHAHRPIPNSCLVFSIQNEDVNKDFARHVSLQLGCETHRFYPSQTNSTREAPKIYDHVLAAPKDHQKSPVVISLSNLKNNQIIDLLTLKTRTEDVEEFAKSNQTSIVKQLSVVLEASVKHTTSKGYRRLLKILRTLWRQGFRIYHYERKIADGCLKDVKLRTAFTNCYVLYMVNSNLTEKAVWDDKTRQNEQSATLAFPQDDELPKMPADDLENIYHRYIHSIEYGCQEIIRAGNLRDGGWEICHDQKLRPRYPCLVYSFGINNDFSFDDDISQTYGCETHSFDPSMHKREHRRSEREWFHDVGLLGENRDDGGKHGNWKMRTLESIIKKLNHTQRRIDILKMDIEESEWSALPNMMDTTSLDNVVQLLVEFHSKGNSPHIMKTLKRLHEYGFRIFWTSGNEACQYKTYNGSRSFCNEVYFVNTKFL